MNWVKIMLAEFGRADSQRLDWYGWVTNQCGHMLIGLTLTWLGVVFAMAPLGAAAVVLSAYAIKEWRDTRRGGSVADSLTDFAFVTGGALMALAQWAQSSSGFFMALALTSLLALHGIRRRITRHG